MPLPLTNINNPVVSLYVLNHNYGEYIAQAIQSCLNQTYSDFELVIIDDGSTDHSRELIQPYEGVPNITVVYQSNHGLTPSANVALKLARGKYIMRLDADDWLEPDALRRMTDEITKEPNAAYLFPDYWLTDPDGNRTTAVSAIELFPDHNPAAAPPHGACTLIDVHKMQMAGLYNESILRGDGVDLYHKLHTKEKVIHLPFRAFNYRQHEKNLSKNPINFY